MTAFKPEPEHGPEPISAQHAIVLGLIHEASFPAEETWSGLAIAEQLTQPGVFGLAIDAAGFVLARVAADEAEILTLAVLPQARRHGVATLLMQACLDQAAGRGAGAMFLEVSDTNHPARALYQRFGFQRVGLRRGYYPGGGNALVLRRDLSPVAATAL